MADPIRLEIRDGVAFATVDSPPMNLLDADVLGALAATTATVAARDASTGRCGAVRGCRADPSRAAEALRQGHARACPGCTCASSCGATHGTEARACWGRRATGATPSVRGAPSSSRRWPLRRPVPLGRHAAARRAPERERVLLVSLQGVITRMIPVCRPRQKTVRMRPSDLLGLSPGEAKPSPRPTGDARLARSRRSG